jgi:hypothetical protein
MTWQGIAVLLIANAIGFAIGFCLMVRYINRRGRH